MMYIIGTVAVIPCLSVVLPMAKANAHGYISTPPSRQAQCAQGVVQCGPIKYEPQSVEGPKGLRNCSGSLPQFAELDDDSKPWVATPVGKTASFTWTTTAQHRTAGWEYYIGATRVAYFDGNNAPPGVTLTHTVDLSQFGGRQKLLAIWTIGDTPNAFYTCVDLQLGGSQAPSAAPSAPTTTTPPPPATPAPAGAARAWASGSRYAVGDTVTYNGKTYRCLQAHTALDPNWTPPATPALWQEI
jgi:predicted carbohydrate-binding protein with CBM5 and CBM33 domain